MFFLKNNKRFSVEDVQSFGFSGVKILVDNDTGVNYLVYFIGQSLSMTPLLDSNGNVIINSVDKK